MFFVAALVICLVIKFRFPKGKSIARTISFVSEELLLLTLWLRNKYHILFLTHLTTRARLTVCCMNNVFRRILIHLT